MPARRIYPAHAQEDCRASNRELDTDKRKNAERAISIGRRSCALQRRRRRHLAPRHRGELRARSRPPPRRRKVGHSDCAHGADDCGFCSSALGFCSRCFLMMGG